MENELEQEILERLKRIEEKLDQWKEMMQSQSAHQSLSNASSHFKMPESIPNDSKSAYGDSENAFAALKRPDNMMHEFTHITSSQSEIVDNMVDEMLDQESLDQQVEVGDHRHMGFTSTHLILLISSLSSIILFILGVFFVAGQ